MVEVDIPDNKPPAARRRLFDCYRLMVTPAALEFVQLPLRDNLNASADWKLRVVRGRHKLLALGSVARYRTRPPSVQQRRQ